MGFSCRKPLHRRNGIIDQLIVRKMAIRISDERETPIRQYVPEGVIRMIVIETFPVKVSRDVVREVVVVD